MAVVLNRCLVFSIDEMFYTNGKDLGGLHAKKI
jgi:hypothetical protein